MRIDASAIIGFSHVPSMGQTAHPAHSCCVGQGSALCAGDALLVQVHLICFQCFSLGCMNTPGREEQ